jgi:signal transduction histidine kinase
MAKGELGQQVLVQSHDEIGELTLAFNQMSAELESLIAQRQQMTADIAHDLRTPLTVISGYVEAMLDGVLEVTPERLETISKEVQHLQRLVEDLRTLSLAEAGRLSLNLVWVSPQDLLQQVAVAYRLAAEKKGVELVLLESADTVEIQVDPDRMMQVLSNLVGNALRHTGTGDVITLQSSPILDQSTITSRPPGILNNQISDHWVVIRVSDTGEGIPSDVLSHIFDRFYQGDSARQEAGSESGLGLSIARSIVAMHEGELKAESEGLGKGSTFSIYLPINQTVHKSSEEVSPPKPIGS